MSINEVRSKDSNSNASCKNVDLKLEAVVIPVSDVDRAKKFYGKLGWRLDADFHFDNGFRAARFSRLAPEAQYNLATKDTPAKPATPQGRYRGEPATEA